jgi:hypothetical protein
MPQMSLYLREPVFQKVKAMSVAESTPASLIVTRLIERSLQTRESTALDSLFGSLAPFSLERPAQGSHTKDAKREPL